VITSVNHRKISSVGIPPGVSRIEQRVSPKPVRCEAGEIATRPSADHHGEMSSPVSDPAPASAHPPVRFAVVGGGLSGLAAAHRLTELARESGRSAEVHLYEASDRLGGLVQTERVGDYVIERGADSFITNKPGAIGLCRRLGLESELISTDPTYRGSLILHDGQPVPTPAGFNLLVPGNPLAVLASPLLSDAGKRRCLDEWFVPPRTDSGDESLASFTRRRLGPEVLDRIVQPLVGGIYTADPEQLSLAATLPRFLDMERRHGSLLRSVWNSRESHHDTDGEAERRAEREAAGARYGLFVAPRHGISQLADTLAERVRTACQIHLDAPVCGLRITRPASGQPAAAELSLDGESKRFGAVILALSAQRMGNLLAPDSAPLAEELRAIPYASSAIVVSGHRLADIRHPLDSFGLVIPHVERRNVLAVSFLSRKFPTRAPEGRVILRTFVGGAMQPEIFALSDEAILKTVRHELRDLLGVDGTPDFEVLTRYPEAMPQYHVGHLDRVREIRRLAAELGPVHLAGNAFDGVGIPDTIQSGEAAAEAAFGAG